MKISFFSLCVWTGLALSACSIPQQMEFVEREQRSLRTESANLSRKNRAIREELNGVRASLADTRATLQQVERGLIALREKVEEIRIQIERQIGQSSRDEDQRVEILELQVAQVEDSVRAHEILLKAREDELRILREALLAGPEGRTKMESEGVGSAGNSGSDKRAEVSDPASREYKEALKFLERKEYKASIAQFKGFLQKYPKNDYADNAQYWIGESHYALREFDQAILEFDLVRRNYPEGDKVPASLLKLGFAFAELGDKVDARLILQELVDRYPQSEEATKAKDKLKALGA
jgi:tol-pal system protein YbgF